MIGLFRVAHTLIENKYKNPTLGSIFKKMTNRNFTARLFKIKTNFK